jgi:tetratricopeptide (TPR) repeat protein
MKTGPFTASNQTPAAEVPMKQPWVRGSIPTFFCVLLLFSAVSVSHANLPASEAFWEDRIVNAIDQRNSVFTSLLGSTATLTISDWSSEIRGEAASLLSIDSSSGVWQQLIYGILRYLEGGTDAERYWNNALTLAANDPGTTWLLVTEFNRYRVDKYTEQALQQLEKQMFIEGAISVPIISRQLLQYGSLRKLSGDVTGAGFLFSWAHRFNRNEYRSFLMSASMNGLRHPMTALSSLISAVKVLSQYWPAQTTFTRSLFTALHQFFFIILVAAGIILCVKYFPLALHRYTHFFPSSVPSALRILFTNLIVISLFSLGLIPFLWVALILLWKHLSRPDRIIGSLLMVIILLAPFDAALANRFRHAVDANGTASRLERSLYGGAATGNHPSNHFEEASTDSELPSSLSEILGTMKRQEWTLALGRLNALKNRDNDPLVNNLKGICHFFTGSLDASTALFEKVLDNQPADPSAQFNLARCHIASNDATRGMELLKKAANAHPSLVNDFIEENDRYFSDNWPPLRQLLFPEYPPSRFWNEIFFAPLHDNSGMNHFWGFSFLGFPPVVSFFIFLLLMITTLLTGRISAGNRQLRRLFSCKYCGRILCRRCTTGTLCSVCADATRKEPSLRSIDKIREQLVNRSANTLTLRNTVFNIFFPGSGSLLNQHSSSVIAISVLLLSSVVYTYWFTVVASQPLHLMTGNEKLLLLFPPCSYHIFFIIRYLMVNTRSIASLFTSPLSGKGS